MDFLASAPPSQGNESGANTMGWEWDVPLPPAATSICVPQKLAERLLDENQAYEAICKIYKEHLKNDVVPNYEIEHRKAMLHLDTRHVVFTNFSYHFRYTAEGQDFLLEMSKRKAALKAGQWLFDVLQKSGSIYKPAPLFQPLPPMIQPVSVNQPELLQEFMAHRANTEEQLRVLSQTVAVLLEENKKLVKQNHIILKKLEEIKDAQSKNAFESLADAAFAQSHGRK